MDINISLIIPVYNAADYIIYCLQSLAIQTMKPHECIIIDDCSTDDSINIIKHFITSYQGSIHFELLINKQNSGVSFSRNRGIETATGDYIYFLDPDDSLPPNSLHILSNYAIRYGADIVVGNYKTTGDINKSFSKLKIKQEIYLQGTDVLVSYLRKEWYDMAWNKLIKRALIDNWDFPFPLGVHPGEDSLFSFMLADKATSVVAISETTYIYTIRQGSAMQQHSKKKIESIYMYIKELVEYVNNRNLLHNYPEVLPYLESQRVYFIKTLLYGQFNRSYITRQWQDIDILYTHFVWKNKMRTIEFIFKDFTLLLWSICKKKQKHYD